jgi:uncharacterized protein YecE (DUF72 family)
MSLHIGTSGWAYKEWKPAFYPADLPSNRFLEHYGSVLTGCEINATFYRLQSEAVMAGWAAAVPDGFRFAVKAHKRLTFTKQMAWTDDDRAFLARFVAPLTQLGDRFGAIHFRYPETRERDDAGLAAVLEAMPDGLPFAMDFRHASWMDPSVLSAVAERGGTVCVGETAGDVLERLPPGPFAYVRLRADRYSEAARDGWLQLVQREGATRPVFAFARHEDLPAGDPFCGIGLAEWLMAQHRATGRTA